MPEFLRCVLHDQVVETSSSPKLSNLTADVQDAKDLCALNLFLPKLSKAHVKVIQFPEDEARKG
ncbi:hypothetical protein PsorP6_000419 [Peronosclerospora sorghi]|uniref:Uncharacterized protein n=1 Tax=Peronosclerospora sorghi TaxID=230839 RepID=A0ACC0WR77_9STRA|nr:hypothetical protein PsorP6_000419 [Peronosclerospora sorghi]